MRISADPKSNCHWALYFLTAPLVLLDGQPQSDAIEADDEQGIVTRCVRAGDGHLLLDGNEIRVEQISGAVEFRGERRAASPSA